MNKGFKKYFKQSYKASIKALKKKDNYFRYLLFMMIDSIANIIFFIKPITNIAKIKLVKNIKIEKRIVLSKTIEVMDEPKSYWTSVITILMKGLLFVGIVGIHLIVISVLVLFGGLVQTIIKDSDYVYLAAIFAVPAMIALMIFIIVSKYLTIPTAYIVDTNPNLGASKVLYTSIASLKETGKRTMFVNDLVHGLIYLGLTLPYIIVGVIAYLLPQNVMQIIIVFLALAYSVMALFFIPVLSLSHQMVLVSLFDDIVIDKYSINQRISGVRMIEFNKKAQMPIEDRLKAVFDDEEELQRESSLYKKTPSLVEKEANYVEAKRLLDEKIKDMPKGADLIHLEEDNLYIEEDKLYVEDDNIGNGGE